MRTLFLLLGWLGFSTWSLATPANHQFQLDGSWYHKKSDNWIEIRDEGKYISVMGLPPYGKARIFEKQWREIYIDKKGNKISIEGPGLLLYHHRSSGHVLTFERPVKAHGTGGTWRGEKDRWNNHGQRDDSYYNDFSPRDAEGTWQALGGIDIAIVLTREGLRAKYSGTTHWVDYRMLGNDGITFEDNKGNRYVFSNATTATWYPAERNRNPIVLKKTDNQVKY